MIIHIYRHNIVHYTHASTMGVLFTMALDDRHLTGQI